MKVRTILSSWPAFSIARLSERINHTRDRIYRVSREVARVRSDRATVEGEQPNKNPIRIAPTKRAIPIGHFFRMAKSATMKTRRIRITAGRFGIRIEFYHAPHPLPTHFPPLSETEVP
jgi:hypothetical protein